MLKQTLKVDTAVCTFSHVYILQMHLLGQRISQDRIIYICVAIKTRIEAPLPFQAGLNVCTQCAFSYVCNRCDFASSGHTAHRQGKEEVNSDHVIVRAEAVKTVMDA